MTMNIKMIVYISGRIFCALGIFLLFPIIPALYYGESTARNSFGIVALSLFVLGFLISMKKPEKQDLYTREGMATVALAWLLVSLCGALPMWIAGDIPNYIDALFETASGFTTTGSTILTEIETLSHATLFWRSFMHWLGGMGVLVLLLMFVPMGDTRTMHIVRAESAGPTVGKLKERLSDSIKQLFTIYVTLTLLECIALLLCGMNLFEAITHTFSTAGTGGFGITNGSVADYDSVAVDVVITLFMALFSINFSLYYYACFLKKPKMLWENEELRAFLGISLFSIVAIAINIMSQYEGFFTALRYSSFQVMATISTTGFATADFTEWPYFSQCIILLLMFVGGCAGSTGGGLKVFRIMVLFKTSCREIMTVLKPRSVISVKSDGKAVDQNIVRGICSYFILFCFLMALSILLLSLDGHDVPTTVTAVITCMNNVGPGLSEICPSGNFSGFSGWAKVLLSLDMLMGRLELYPLLVLFSLKKK